MLIEMIQILVLFGTSSCIFGLLMFVAVYLAWKISRPDNGWDR